MNLKDIASISGKSGLYLVVKPTRSGVILETIDENKTRIIASSTTRVSLLKEISIYTTGNETSTPLEIVFQKIHAQFNNILPVNSKSNPTELNSFLEKVLPDYDKDKVYHSDIKKLVTWYQSILNIFPERFQTSTIEKNEGEGNIEYIEGNNENPATDLKPEKPKKAKA